MMTGDSGLHFWATLYSSGNSTD